MGSDLIVALKEASANRTTLFGVNHHATPSQCYAVQIVPGQMHDAGDMVPIQDHQVPQARQTCSALGLQPAGKWGFVHGVNEHRVAIGVTDWQSRLRDGPPALSGIDLTRLCLERSHSATHAVEILTDLLERHRHSLSEGSAPSSGDNIFLIADCAEAYVLEACGRYWALLECGHSRAVTDVAMIRQDWRRLAPGLADTVIEKGWWQDDGSKIDVVRSVGETSERSRNAQKRWGRASLALSQQHGAIDLHFLRRMMADHYSTNRDLLFGPKATALANSFLVDLYKAEQPIVAWIAFGSPRVAIHFPICLAGELPAAFGDSPQSIQLRTLEIEKLAHGKDLAKVELAVERLQMRFDQDAEDFVLKTHRHAQPSQWPSLATEMMHHHVEAFEQEYRRLFGIEQMKPQVVHESEEMLFFA
jgi:hypothetical protein